MSDQERLHALDAVRGFALLLGVAFHAAMPFIPGMPHGVWSVVDTSPSLALADFAFVSHIFRMVLFYFIAGFFARMLLEKRGARGFWANRCKRILIPFVVGWLVLYPAIAAVWVVGIMRDSGGVLPKPPASVPHTFAAFPLVHLWFLYNLMIFYVIVLGIRGLVRAVDRSGALRAAVDRLVTVSVSGCFAVLLLAVPVSLSLLSVPNWRYLQGILTPDHSLIPTLPAFVGYATAVACGWLIHRQPGGLQLIQRRWPQHLAIAVVATAVCCAYLGGQSPIAQVPHGTGHVIYTFAYGIAAWGWTFAITGLALASCAGYSPVRRYLADASYWIYLAHLPLIAAIGVWVGHWPLHWSIKYAFTLSVSLALLLLSYHYLVRPSFIGQQLNGRRYPVWKAPSPQPAAQA